MLILAYADWCGHCKKFKPTWNEFKKKYNKVCDIREVNADSDKKVAQNLQIRGYPTIMMLKDGKKINYQGPRTMEDLEKFVYVNLNSHVEDDLRAYRAFN